jgi:hypothetical protein
VYHCIWLGALQRYNSARNALRGTALLLFVAVLARSAYSVEKRTWIDLTPLATSFCKDSHCANVHNNQRLLEYLPEKVKLRDKTVEDDRDNSPLEEQIFGVILIVPLFTVSF